MDLGPPVIQLSGEFYLTSENTTTLYEVQAEECLLGSTSSLGEFCINKRQQIDEKYQLTLLINMVIGPSLTFVHKQMKKSLLNSSFESQRSKAYIINVTQVFSLICSSISFMPKDLCKRYMPYICHLGVISLFQRTAFVYPGTILDVDWQTLLIKPMDM